jgi:hypothetical protein
MPWSHLAVNDRSVLSQAFPVILKYKGKKKALHDEELFL